MVNLIMFLIMDLEPSASVHYPGSQSIIRYIIKFTMDYYIHHGTHGHSYGYYPKMPKIHKSLSSDQIPLWDINASTS